MVDVVDGDEREQLARMIDPQALSRIHSHDGDGYWYERGRDALAAADRILATGWRSSATTDLYNAWTDGWEAANRWNNPVTEADYYMDGGANPYRPVTETKEN